MFKKTPLKIGMGVRVILVFVISLVIWISLSTFLVGKTGWGFVIGTIIAIILGSLIDRLNYKRTHQARKVASQIAESLDRVIHKVDQLKKQVDQLAKQIKNKRNGESHA